MMSVKVHESFSIDSFQDRLLWWDDFLGDQLQDEWRSTGSAGSTAVVDAQTGGIVRITTGATTGNHWRIDWGDIRSLIVSKKVTIEVRLKLTQTTKTRIWAGLEYDGTHYITFYLDTDVSANWYKRNRNNPDQANEDTGITADTNYHIFRIECFPTGEVHYYIDGTETANSPETTVIPPEYMGVYLYIATLEDVAKSVDIDYVVVRQEI